MYSPSPPLLLLQLEDGREAAHFAVRALMGRIPVEWVLLPVALPLSALHLADRCGAAPAADTAAATAATAAGLSSAGGVAGRGGCWERAQVEAQWHLQQWSLRLTAQLTGLGLPLQRMAQVCLLPVGTLLGGQPHPEVGYTILPAWYRSKRRWYLSLGIT